MDYRDANLIAKIIKMEPLGTQLHMHTPDLILDCRGKACPIPILQTKKCLAGMNPGQVLRIRTTDPASVRDFEAFARQTGHELVSSERDGDEFMFLVRCRHQR